MAGIGEKGEKLRSRFGGGARLMGGNQARTVCKLGRTEEMAGIGEGGEVEEPNRGARLMGSSQARTVSHTASNKP